MVAERAVAWMEKHKYLILFLLTIVYSVGARNRAAGKPFWYDEVITLIAAQTPDLATTWKAALQCDANPPLPHLLTHLAIRWFGMGEVGARLPAIAGFWIFCLCLFRFVYRRAGICYALSALLMPVVTEAYYYSAEARAYGPELAFSGLALVAWQAATENSRRFVALPGLAVSVAAALLCHYFAVLLYLPLAGGEAFRSYRTRKIHWGVWAALAVGATPVILRVATIVAVVKGFNHTWAPAHLGQAFEFWETGLQHGASFWALLLGLLALLCVRGKGDNDSSAAIHIPSHELVAGALFLAIPLAAVAGGLLVTHMFSARYALIGLTGVCLLGPMVAAEFFGPRALPGLLMTAVLMLGFELTLIDHSENSNPYNDDPILREALEQGPVVIPDGQLFLQMWHYAPEHLKQRLVFPVDLDAAVKYMGFDTIDGGVEALKHWSSVNVVAWKEFAAPGREFVVYQNLLRPGWVLPRVLDEGAAVQIKKYRPYRTLVSVRLGRAF
jgi:hypothetical protein